MNWLSPLPTARRLGLAIAALALLGGCGGEPTRETADAAVADAQAPDAPASRPQPPAALTHYLTGSAEDVVTPVATPTLLLMGGGTDVDEAFSWWSSRIDGGDLVVIRTSGADGYNDYLFNDIGGFDSVETMIVDNRELANDPYVGWTIAHAEAIFIAGGDQSLHLSAWRDTAVSLELTAAYQRGAFLGGTSAGLAVLSEFIFAANNGSVSSGEALANPYDLRVTLEGALVKLPPMAGLLADSHFVTRDRMGRLITFLARLVVDGLHPAPTGLGIDEAAALVVDERGNATVLGTGSAYWVVLAGARPVCEPDRPLRATADIWRFVPGSTFSLAAGPVGAPDLRVNATSGMLSPPAPY